MFYADRNIRPCTILGYTLTTFPQKLNTDKRSTNNKRTTNSTELRAEEGPCIIGGESRQRVFYTARKRLNRIKKGGKSQPQNNRKKDNTKFCILFHYLYLRLNQMQVGKQL